MCCFPWEWYDAGKVNVPLSHPKATKLFFFLFLQWNASLLEP